MSKINDTKVRRNTNKKFNFDYSCDLIFIIIKMIHSIRKNKEKNQMNNIIKDDDKTLIKIIYNSFIDYYKPLDENVSLNEETGHINFIIVNKEKYKMFLNQIEEMEKNIHPKPMEISNNNIYNLNTNNF